MLTVGIEMGKGNKYGSGTRWSVPNNDIKGKILYESICNYTGCYNDSKSRYGYCVRHLDGRQVNKNGEWYYDN